MAYRRHQFLFPDHKNKIGTCPPPPPKKKPKYPPLKRGICGHGGFSCRKNAIFQRPIKLAQPFPAPELRAKNFADTRIFLNLGEAEKPIFFPVVFLLFFPFSIVQNCLNPTNQIHCTQSICRLSDISFLSFD